MKLIKTADAVGHMLCHDMTQIIKGEYKDARFRKGHIVTPEDNLTVVATATAEMCGQVIYPAAVLNTSAHQEAAAAFLAYLQGAEASAEFEAVLFTPLSK